MALRVPQTQAQAAQEQIEAEKSTEQLAKTRKAAEVLSDRRDGG